MRIFDWVDLTRYLAILTIPLGVVLCSVAFSQNHEPGSDCLFCHDDIYQKGVSNFYGHSPFVNKECAKCHLKEGAISVRSDLSGTEGVQPVVLNYPEYLTEHTILLHGLIPQAAYDIDVKLEDISGEKVEKEFRGIVPADVNNVKLDDKEPPKIYGVKVGPIVRGVFLETTITWKTDEPSTSRVEYGFSDQYGRRTPEDNALVEHHGIKIYELEKEKDYHFRVRSKDIFENEAVSRGLTFNTAESLPPSQVEEKAALTEDDTRLAVSQGKPFLVGSELGLYLQTTKPANMTIEYLKLHEPTVAEETQVQGTTVPEDKGRLLRDGTALTVDACYQCHPPKKLGVSHPVGVAPKGKTKVPDDLPTLEGGIITCITCHDVHGGNRRYFARKKIAKDICISCHEGY